MPLERVLRIIQEGSGSHFDALCVDALERVVAEDAEFLERLRAV
jgi:HD-GYP domain-containing protein (c-di-GMP phosphodiesterase class II)